MKPKMTKIDMVIDKLIDGLFIFLGVYVAFYFNQWQEDQRSIKELNFHLSMILRELPKKDAEKEIKEFKIVQTKDNKGNCHINRTLLTTDDSNGLRHLNVIYQRGLGTYLPNDRLYILPMLSLYYGQLISKSSKASESFITAYSNSLLNAFNEGCVSKEQVKIMEEKLRPIYGDYKLKEHYANAVGYALRKELLDMGVEKLKAPEKSIGPFEFKFENKETEKEMKGKKQVK